MLVVADTSVLLNLCRIREERLLLGLFHSVQIPPAVRLEFVKHSLDHHRFLGLAIPNWVRERRPQIIPAEVTGCPGLDAGEAEALALALEIRADAVLLDELAGRHAAVRLHLPYVGTVGILIRAKRSGLIIAVQPLIEQLEQEAGYWISPRLRTEILRLAGE